MAAYTVFGMTHGDLNDYAVENKLFIASFVWIVSCTKVSLLVVTFVLFLVRDETRG
jgi:hypothetical protein